MGFTRWFLERRKVKFVASTAQWIPPDEQLGPAVVVNPMGAVGQAGAGTIIDDQYFGTTAAPNPHMILPTDRNVYFFQLSGLYARADALEETIPTRSVQINFESMKNVFIGTRWWHPIGGEKGMPETLEFIQSVAESPEPAQQPVPPQP
ncbi:MAG: hypothetical protein QOJ12_1493 [Thermoleophilales bacterium]|nr:hypothetical protein [Thermoleophilales bacterium]